MNGSSWRVAIRADASPVIGLGHVKRCLALAEALLALGADVCMVHRALGVDVRTWIDATGARSHELPSPANSPVAADTVPHAAWAEVEWQRDAEETIDALRDWAPQWLIIDHYAFDARWHRHVGSGLHVRLAAIDDLADRELDSAVLVDHNLGPPAAQKYAGRVRDKTRMLTGPRYALLGKRYADGLRWRMREPVGSIGIFMGGVDAAGVSAVALRACREKLRFKGDVEIATTSANPHLVDLSTLATKWPATRVLVDQPDLADFFARHDLQIGAGGGATWERCCIGAPTLAVSVSHNQLAVIPALASQGALESVEVGDPAEPEALVPALRRLLSDASHRQRLAAQAHSLVDGIGARRVAIAIAADRLEVRTATMDDAEQMYAWRNHPQTRAVSGDSAPLAYTDHVAWLRRTLSDPRRCLLAGHVGRADVGFIRFDLRDDGFATVSLYLDPMLTGLGLGGPLLQAGESQLHGTHSSALAGMVATVMTDNVASQRLFQSAGYRFRDGQWWKPLEHSPHMQGEP